MYDENNEYENVVCWLRMMSSVGGRKVCQEIERMILINGIS